MKLKAIIKKKNSGKPYSHIDLQLFIEGYVKDLIDDKTMEQFIRSIYTHGMNHQEIVDLTNIMTHSGNVVDLSAIPGIKVDKHSTGGVGDKITLIVGPLVAAFGVPIAKMSGRGLGFTGGTLDKLESIPGYNIKMSIRQFIKNVKKHGIAINGQTNDLVPADKKIYALRDETNLVDSIPLIASSIMSKKIATGADAILLDVKCGDAAFMKDQKSAEELARTMIELGKSLSKDVRAEITSMNDPLGRAIGNKIEVIEAMRALRGEWTEDLKQVTYSSASTMLVQAKVFKTEAEAMGPIDEAIKSLKAYDKAREWIEGQKGNFDIILKPEFWKPSFNYEVKAQKDGFLEITSAVKFGILAMHLGAGRVHKEDKIDWDAGIYLNKKTGEEVKTGDVLFTLYANRAILPDDVKTIDDAYKINKTKKTHKIILNKL